MSPEGRGPVGNTAGFEVKRTPSFPWEYRMLNEIGYFELFCLGCKTLVKGRLINNGRDTCGPALCECGNKAYIRQRGKWWEVG